MSLRQVGAHFASCVCAHSVSLFTLSDSAHIQVPIDVNFIPLHYEIVVLDLFDVIDTTDRHTRNVHVELNNLLRSDVRSR